MEAAARAVGAILRGPDHDPDMRDHLVALNAITAYLAEPDVGRLERMAQATAAHRFGKGYSYMLWDDMPGNYRVEMLAEVVAAIKAMSPDGG